MSCYTFNIQRNSDGTINHDFYRAAARKERHETRVRLFRKGLIAIKRVMPALAAKPAQAA
jgi:hypothetical protein